MTKAYVKWGQRLIVPLALLIRVIVSIVLVSMMALTVVDVFGRYVLNRPVLGSFEITEVLLAGLVFCALPLVSLSKEHITVDLTDHFFSARWAKWRDAMVTWVCAACMAFLTWRFWFKALEAVEYGDMTAALHIPMAPLVWVMCAMSAVTLFILVVQAIGWLPSLNPAQSVSDPSSPVSGDTL